MQDCKEFGSGLQFIKCDSVTDGQEIKVFILVEFLVFLLSSFCLLVHISLHLSLLATFFFLFKMIKPALSSYQQAPGHNHENTGQCSFQAVTKYSGWSTSFT